MRALLRMAQAIDSTTDLFGRIASIAVIPVILISAANATIRYVFNYSSNGWLEIQWYLFSCIFLCAAAYCLLHNDHVRIDLISNMFSKKFQSFLDILTIALFVLPFTIIMTWLGWHYFSRSLSIWETSSDVGGLIRWPVKALIPICFVLLVLQSTSELIKRVGMIQGHLPYPSDDGQQSVAALIPEESRNG